MIGNPYPQFQNIQEWNDFVNEVRHYLDRMNKTVTELYQAVEESGGTITVPDATSTVKGIMKLYTTAGNNTDGTITQRALTVSQQQQDAQIAAVYATQTAMQTAISAVQTTLEQKIDDDNAAQNAQIAAIYATQTAMQEAIAEATEAGVSMIELAVTIPTTGWTDSSKDGYPYKYTYSNAVIKETMIPFLIFGIDEMLKATRCGISPACETENGGLVIYSRSIPLQNISASLKLQEIKE